MKIPRPAETRLVLTIKKSIYGWTAYHPSGKAVAHAQSKPLLEAYVKDAS